MADLAPPTQHVEDPGAHELQDSSDDHFSDASEGHRASASSPIPTTRVERVDDQPAHGEVPGTPAYGLRTQDAVPDEIEVVPEGQRSRSSSQRFSDEDRPLTPGGTMIPKTVVEKVEPDHPSYGEIPGTAAYEMRTADAAPDVVLTAPDATRKNLEGEPTANHRSRSRSSSNSRSSPSREVDDELPTPLAGNGTSSEQPPTLVQAGDEDAEADEEDGFGDDFDDFEEGAEADEDDFGDFGQVAEETPTQSEVPTPLVSQTDPLSHLPSLDLYGLNSLQEIHDAISPYMQELFPHIDTSDLSTTPKSAPAPDPLLSDRSASLWSQLVAPPPLQPPNWIRSRIRRLFLVSLGVPVDLDEILPASKQKKLILPSIHLTTDSPRDSNQLSHISKENASSTSITSSRSRSADPNTKKDRPKKKATSERPGPPPPPEFNANAASLLCKTTETAMDNFTDKELEAHLALLQETAERASEVLEYWVKRKDSAVGDKEAFEGVIENLVAFAKKAKAGRGKR